MKTNGATEAPTRVLLIEDDPVDAQRIRQALAGKAENRYSVVWMARLADGLERLRREHFDVVLLDLALPDGQGLDAFDQVLLAAPQALILTLSGDSDEDVGRQSVQRGAHDYFAKSHVNAHWLPRALGYILQHQAARGALRESEERFRAISDASPLGIFVSDQQGGCAYTNAAYQRISGLNLAQTLGSHWSAAIHPDDRSRVLAEWAAAEQGGPPFQSEVRFLRQDGKIVWARLNAATMHEGKNQSGHVQTVEDISQRKADEEVLRAAEAALFEEKERAQVTLNSIGDAVLTTDLAGKVSYLNQVAEEMTGWSYDQALGRPIAEVFRIIDSTTRQAAANPAQRAIEEDQVVGLAADSVLIRRDGGEVAIEDSAAPIHNRDGKVIGAVIVFHDVSEARFMALKLAHQAQHDFLTGLPNRMLLTERLSQAIGLVSRHRKQVAVMFVDLDHFKQINDSLGHAIGDQLLQSVAKRLSAGVRTTDTVCRHGGDEFVILLAEIELPQDAANVAAKLIAAFAAPHVLSGHQIHVGLSIGISVYPQDGANTDALLLNADTAMYHAKTAGRNNFQFFREEMNSGAVRHQFAESNLRRGLKQREFLVHYQPQINLGSGRMTAAEALIRWFDPAHGLVYPEQFIAVAEECGLMVPIGRWMLHEVCRQIKTWQDSGLPVVPVAVNISALEFRHQDFPDSLAQILKETKLAPCYLELELTESVLMHDAESSVSVLRALKTLGVLLAIDEFGTGYSSFNYLKRFPIDTLKIDHSFVRNISTGADGATIVGAVIGMGRSLNQRVIAGGIETPEQLAFLQQRQCDEGQGFLFGQPLPAGEFALLLGAGKNHLPH